MRNRIIETLFLMFIDTIIIIIAFILAYYFRLGTFDHGAFLFFPYIQMAFITLPIWILLLVFSGRYSLKEQTLRQHFQHVIFASLSSALLFPLLFYFQNEQFFSRGIILLIFFVGTILLFSNSYFLVKVSQWKASKNLGISRMLVIGAGRSAQKIITHLIQSNSRHKPVAVLTPYGSRVKEVEGVKVLGKLDALERVFEEYNIDEIFLCEAVEHSENLASFCRNKGVVLRTSLATLGVEHHKIDAELIGSTLFLTLQQSPLFGWGQFFKRLFDIIISFTGLIIFSPYILFNWKHKKTITIMNGTEESFSAFMFEKNKKGYGRNITLLWNVLKKQLSIVGPKALSQKEYEEIFKEKKLLSASRFILRPGIFGPCIPHQAQSVEHILRKEIRYIRNWSFWEDINILFRK